MQQQFLTALRENEDDLPTRLVYADWLEDQGMTEEAKRQRRWKTSKEWLIALAKKFGVEYEEDFRPKGNKLEIPRMTYAELLSAGYHNKAKIINKLGQLGQDAQQFWENWSVVTGEYHDP